MANRYENEEMRPFADGDSSDDDRSYKKRGSDDGGGAAGIFYALCCICCCCCCVIIPMMTSIAAAVSSVGYTECPAIQPPTVNATNATALPLDHMLVTQAYQWNYFKETNVYNPNISNITRIGRWRTTKTWYLRSQWAYIPEGSKTAVAIAWQPWWSWTRTFHLKRCIPLEETILQQDIVWFSSYWGGRTRKWSILNKAGTAIATADHNKAYNWGWYAVPNGWNSVVTSLVQPGVAVGTMMQSFNSYWARDSVWRVNDTRPDLVQPYVLSFLASSIDLASAGGDRRRRGTRRLGDLRPNKQNAQLEELE